MIIFDVGANDGKSTIHHCTDSNNVVYVFEPTPELCNKYLYPNALMYKNYHVISKAVSDFDGRANFNIAGHDDWGCSSFYEFTDDIANMWDHRTDFYFNTKIEVDVIRMDTFITQNNIDVVDFLHCDTQGSDIKVLQSFGNQIGKLKSGVVESPQPNAIPLYKNAKNSFKDIMSFLQESGFENIEWKPNGIRYECKFECNIHFSRKSI